MKIELSTCMVTEVVGEISDRDVSRAERLVADNIEVFNWDGKGCMAKSDLTDKDRERFDSARARGALRARDGSGVVSARYDARRDTLDLTFRGGGSMVIPRRLVPGLARRAVADVDAPVVSPAGDALRWPALDLDVYVPDLVARAFGTHLFAAATGRLGGRRRSKAKAAAAKLNGAKGGRPRKKLSA